MIFSVRRVGEKGSSSQTHERVTDSFTTFTYDNCEKRLERNMPVHSKCGTIMT